MGVDQMQAALAAFLPGKAINFGGGTANYRNDGSYVWRDAAGPQTGTWAVQGDVVCIQFKAGYRRCDQYGKDATGYFLMDQNGKRHDVQRISAI